MKPTLPDPSKPCASDREAFHVLDDDGNPNHPPEPDCVARVRWGELARHKVDTALGAVRHRAEDATALLRRHSALSMAFAFGAAYVLGRALAARAS